MRLVIWVLFVLSCGTSMAHDEGFKIDLMQRHLDSIKDITSLPQRGNGYEFVILAKVVPESIRNRFDTIQSHVFGQQLITLSYCQEEVQEDGSSGGIMSAMFETSHICIYENGFLDLLNKLNTTVDSEIVTYILAHEIAHFITELSIPDGSSGSRTINGNISVYTHSFDAFVTEQTGVAIQNMSQEQMDNLDSFVPAYMQLGSKAHAEVDVFGYLIMKKAGLRIPFDMIFNSFEIIYLGSSNEFQADIRERRRAAQLFQRWAFDH